MQPYQRDYEPFSIPNLRKSLQFPWGFMYNVALGLFFSKKWNFVLRTVGYHA